MNKPVILSERIFSIYYYLTPVFILIDLVAGKSFRAAGLELPFRYYYYGLCLLCALLCYAKPALSALVTLFESSTNMLVLLLGVMLPIFNIEQAVENNATDIGLAGERLINFLLSGSMIAWSFHASVDRLQSKNVNS